MEPRRNEPLEPVLREVMAELSANRPDRVAETAFALIEPINCDRVRITQLFSNLLSNALSYGSADQPVRVRAISDAGSFELSVTNAGAPIPPDALERLFHLFIAARFYTIARGLASGLTSPTKSQGLMAARSALRPRQRKLARSACRGDHLVHRFLTPRRLPVCRDQTVRRSKSEPG
jgi:hypothetical protein